LKDFLVVEVPHPLRLEPLPTPLQGDNRDLNSTSSVTASSAIETSIMDDASIEVSCSHREDLGFLEEQLMLKGQGEIECN
jgi:hypothetical protein